MLYFVFLINVVIFLFIIVILVYFLNLKIRCKLLLLVFNGNDMFFFYCLIKIGIVYRIGFMVLVILKLYIKKNFVYVYDYKENLLG